MISDKGVRQAVQSSSSLPRDESHWSWKDAISKACDILCGVKIHSDLDGSSHGKDTVSSMVSNLRLHADRCQSVFDLQYDYCERNMQRVLASDQNFSSRLFPKMVDLLFCDWRDNPPLYMPVVQAWAFDKFEHHFPHLSNSGDVQKKAALGMGLLGMLENKAPYHGNNHYLDVLAYTIFLAFAHNKKQPNNPIKGDSFFRLMAAAPIHDLSHDGKTNFRDGKNLTPFFLEQQSADIACLYLGTAGFDVCQEDCCGINTMIYSTDCCAETGVMDVAPSTQARLACEFHFHSGDQPDLSQNLQPLLKSKSLARDSLYLHLADIAPSIAVSYDYYERMTELLAAEVNSITSSSPKAALFLQKIFESNACLPGCDLVMKQGMKQISSEAAQKLNA